MTLGKSPIAVRVPNQEKSDDAIGASPKDDAARTDLLYRLPFCHPVP
jgi:hypothetical protein